MRKLKAAFMGMLMVTALFIIGRGVYNASQANDIRAVQEEEAPETEIRTEESAGAEIPDGERLSEVEAALQEPADIYYAYQALKEPEQAVYRELYGALAQMQESVTLSTVEERMIDRIYSCVMNDHPELFYVEGYRYTAHTTDGVITAIVFEGTYSMTAQEAAALERQIEEKLRACFAEVPMNEDEYSTIAYLYEYLIEHTEYDKDAENNQNILSVFLEGRSVCQGYALALQYLLQRVGIQAMVVTGFTNGERHAWDLVRVNGAYYYIDPTWGDASYANGAEAADGGSTPPINYDYFLVTTDELTRTHSIERVVPLPICTSTEDNYFVREGFYFESYDREQLAQIFDSEAARTTDYVTIKCGSIETYNDFMHRLIDSQEIFDFISNQGSSIAFTSNHYQRTISFWNIFY
ncbi:MAG: hypothetical protein NC337_13410 [Roseburia sp.]|nr:hypothetical protein [Roseburia sp.]